MHYLLVQTSYPSCSPLLAPSSDDAYRDMLIVELCHLVNSVIFHTDDGSVEVAAFGSLLLPHYPNRTTKGKRFALRVYETTD